MQRPRKVSCPICLGKGSLPLPFPPFVNVPLMWMTCHKCEGKGRLFKKDLLLSK